MKGKKIKQDKLDALRRNLAAWRPVDNSLYGDLTGACLDSTPKENPEIDKYRKYI